MSNMKPLHCLFCCLWLLAAAATAPAQEVASPLQTVPARLDDAIDLALRNRLEVAIISQQSAGAVSKVNVAHGYFLPQISLSGTTKYIRSLDKFSGISADASLGGQTFHVGVEKTVPSFELNAGIDLTYNLYAGGRDKANLEEAIAEQTALKEEECATKLQVRREVMNAYWQLRKAQISSRVADRSYQHATKLYLIAQTRREAGLISEMELETEGFSLKESMLAVADARRDVTKSLAKYRETLGIDAPSPQPAATEAAVLVDDPDQINDEELLPAIEQPKTRKLISEAMAAEARVKASKAVYLPKIDFFTSYRMVGRDDDYFKTALIKPDYYTIGLNFSFTLFDGFKDRIALAKTEEEIARLRVIQTMRELEIQTSSMNIDKEKVQKEIKQAEHRVTLYAMKKKLAQEMYRNGKISRIELNDAEKNYDDAADKLLISKIDLAAAKQSLTMSNRTN